MGVIATDNMCKKINLLNSSSNYTTESSSQMIRDKWHWGNKEN